MVFHYMSRELARFLLLYKSGIIDVITYICELTIAVGPM